MKTVTLKLPELGFVVVTRGMLAFGAGLLASARIPAERRHRIGLLFVAFGVASTIPAAMSVVKHLSE